MLVLYSIEGEESGENNLNALEIPRINVDKEIFLIDILNYIQSNKHLRDSLGVKFNFQALVNNKLINLDSPASLIPVNRENGIVQLHLTPATSPPLIPFGQSGHFNDASRFELYSASDYSKTKGFAHASFSNQASLAATQQPTNSPAVDRNSDNITPAPRNNPNTNNQRAAEPSRPAPYSDNFTSAPQNTQRNAAPQSSPQPSKPPKPTKQKSSSAFDKQFQEHNNPNSSTVNDIGLHAYIGEEASTAINESVETVKEAASVAARSIFNFAAMSLKSVVDVANNITNNTLNQNVVNVGNTKVTIVRQLAEGGFGIVYLVTTIPGVEKDGSVNTMHNAAAAPSEPKQYALKQLLCQSREQVAEAHHELEALIMCNKLHCDYIIKLLDHSSIANSKDNSRMVNMLFPLYPRGTAFDAIERCLGPQLGGSGAGPWPFPEHQAVYITLCMATALQKIHDKGFAHRDVKPHNVLLSDFDPSTAGNLEHFVQMGKPVLMDLGSMTASRVEVTTKSQALQLEDEAASKTSPAYRPPELTAVNYVPCSIDERVDVWSLGCTLYCLCFGHSPFENTREGVLRLAILNGKYPMPAGGRNIRGEVYSQELLDLIGAMLQVDHNERPFMHDVIDVCKQLLA